MNKFHVLTIGVVAIILLATLSVVFFLPALSPKEQIIETIQDCSSSATVFFLEDLTIKGNLYESYLKVDYLPLDGEEDFCLQWSTELSPPPEIWRIETKWNGESQNSAQWPADGNWARSWPAPDVIEWQKNEDPSLGYKYISKFPFCFKAENKRLNTLEQTYEGAGKLTQKVFNPLENNFLPEDRLAYALGPAFWFPFDGFVLKSGPLPKSDVFSSYRFTQIIRVPNEFKQLRAKVIEGQVALKKFIVVEYPDGKKQEIGDITFFKDVNKEANFILSGSTKEPTTSIIGPICGTNQKPVRFEVEFRRSDFLIALFLFPLLIAFILFCLYLRGENGLRIFEAMLLLFVFQEGINQISPTVRPLSITLFDLAIPFFMLLLGIAWLFKHFKIWKKLGELTAFKTVAPDKNKGNNMDPNTRKVNLPLAAIITILAAVIAFAIIRVFVPEADLLLQSFQGIGILILIILTAIYVEENQKMVKEMEKSREMQNKPHLFFMVKEWAGNKWFSVRNVGKGPAFNIELGFGEKKSGGSEVKREKIEYLDVGESRNYQFEIINRFVSTSKLYVEFQFETLLGKKLSGEEITQNKIFPGTEEEFNEMMNYIPETKPE